MTKQSIIQKTIEVMNRLTDNIAEEISDFADFVIKGYEDQILTEEIQNIMINNKAFDFLHHEEELYSKADIKKVQWLREILFYLSSSFLI